MGGGRLCSRRREAVAGHALTSAATSVVSSFEGYLWAEKLLSCRKESMKLNKQATMYTLAFAPLPVALYGISVKCDLLFHLGFQIVWLMLITILLRKSN
jgi:hypothetical protein